MKKETLSAWLALAFAASIIFLFQVKGVKFYLVPSASMAPTLAKSDYIGGFKAEPSQLQEGDIVVFSGGMEGDFYVKRIIGLPGDTVAVLDGFVYLNGQKLDEPYVVSRGESNLDAEKIPAGKIFVMGDNRLNSYDSREFGPISASLVEARVSFIYSPLSRMGHVG
jgi:signal peptidase I